MKDDYTIFIDFDGTITKMDVGYDMFKKFTGGKTEPIVRRYRRGEVNSHACLKTECEIWNGSPPAPAAVLRYLRQQDLAAGFGSFVKMISADGIRSFIVSEGFDFYIDVILHSNGFSNLSRLTNKAVYKDGHISPEFPYMAEGCGECSNCKGFHIREISDPKSAAVFIGDGHSDLHGARAADIVFAKSFLHEALEKIGRNHFEYGDFYDIIGTWKTLSGKRVFSLSEKLRFCKASEGRRGEFEKLWETGEVMRNVGYPNGLGWDRGRYDAFWKELAMRNFILFAVEDRAGNFLGEAKLSFPDEDGFCRHDLKLLPGYQGRGYGREAWQLLFELSFRRWPSSTLLVTPSMENEKAIRLYESLGFECSGEQQEWVPSSDLTNAVSVRYQRMIKKLIS